MSIDQMDIPEIIERMKKVAEQMDEDVVSVFDDAHYNEWDIREQVDEMLDCEGPVTVIGEYAYDRSRILKEIDPILYDTIVLEHIDFQMTDGVFIEIDDEYYLTEKVIERLELIDYEGEEEE